MKQSNSLISLNIFNIIKQFFNIIQIIQIASNFFQLFAFFDQDPNKIHTLQLIFCPWNLLWKLPPCNLFAKSVVERKCWRFDGMPQIWLFVVWFLSVWILLIAWCHWTCSSVFCISCKLVARCRAGTDKLYPASKMQPAPVLTLN